MRQGLASMNETGGLEFLISTACRNRRGRSNDWTSGNNPGFTSFVSKCTYNEESMELKVIDMEKSITTFVSMIEGVAEFPPNGILLHNWCAELLILRDWQVIHHITDPVSGNGRKFWLELMPCFDAEGFPFAICSGNMTYDILNLKTGKL